VNVEPIEPELTQLIYVWTNKVEGANPTW